MVADVPPWQGELPADIPVIDASDPLLFQFALQHDLRERFLAAITSALESFGDPERCRAILEEAIDDAAIEAWIHDGRPLPSIDTPEMLASVEALDAALTQG